MSKSLENLKSRIKEGKVIPFVGAGVSRAVKNKNKPIHDKNGDIKDYDFLFPGWKELLLRAVKRLEDNGKDDYAGIVKGFLNIDKPSFLEAARLAREGLRTDWYDFLKENLDPDPDCIIDDSLNRARSIWELGCTFLITTNYDHVLRWACPHPNKFTFWDIQNTAELGLLRQRGILNNRPIVWHLHGHIDNASNIILLPDGYEKLYPLGKNIESLYSTAIETFRALLSQYSFLFIGCSMTDQYIVEQLKQVCELYDYASPTHYVFLHESEKERVLSLELPIEIITYERY